MTIVIPKRLVVVLALVVIAVLLAFHTLKRNTSESVARTVEVRGSRVLGTRVDVSGAETHASGAVALSGLVVANPAGFGKGDMISVRRISVQADPSTRVVKRIDLEGVEALIEFQGTRSNFEMVSERVARAAAREADGRTAASGNTSESQQGGASSNAGGGEAPRDDWRVEQVDISGAKVSVRADWTSKTYELRTDGFSIGPLNAGTDDLVRAVMTRFVDKVLVSAAASVDDERVKALLEQKLEALRARLTPS
ncbi:MAG: hypothetical protein WB783_11960 [Arenicellales bacterium]|jgi:hypothetical protein